MDSAGTFQPSTIVVWRKVAQHAETARILGLFPQARVQVVEQQRLAPALVRDAGHPLVAGKRVLLIGAASSFLRYFDGGLGGGLCCAPYFKLVPLSNGCPYFCTYCYLTYIYRDYHPFIKLNTNYGRMFEEIQTAAFSAGGPVAFNMGEMLDSLALDHVSLLTARLVPFFAGIPNAYLMLLTKSANVAGLLRVPAHAHVVVSWTLNPQPVIARHEVGAASLEERLDAARRCQEHGYRIRLRIDPGLLYEGWQSDYAEMIRKTLAALAPENITLGMLRLLPGHFALARQAYGGRGAALQQAGLSERASDGKLRYPTRLRVAFYRFLVDVIRSSNTHVSLGLCRETPEVWSTLGHWCDRHQCNCLIWDHCGRKAGPTGAVRGV